MRAITIFVLAVQVPMHAVYVRRLHDSGKTGWWVLVQLIPLVGWVVLLA